MVLDGLLFLHIIPKAGAVGASNGLLLLLFNRFHVLYTIIELLFLSGLVLDMSE